MTETVLVTGAFGFVGRNLIETLAKSGFNIVAVDLNIKNRLKYFDSNTAKKIMVLEADFTNNNSLRYIYKKIKFPCYLIHLGGYILHGAGQAKKYDALNSIDANIRGGYDLIRILKPKLTGVCLASTLDVYGIPRILPIKENHPVAPSTFYAASKLAMEYYAEIELKNDKPLTILRFTHIYGPDDPHPKVLQLFINAVRSGGRPVIYGDGKDLRDYIHVKDIAKIILKTAYSKKQGLFNVATGDSISLAEMADLVIKSSQKKLTPVYKKRQGIRKDYSFDISKMKNELGFTPEISIEQGISELMGL